MVDFAQRRAGLLFGSFIADSLSLGVHWIYDTEALKKKFGYVDRYHAPGPESYHPTKQAGEQSHIGDQALRLAAFLERTKYWDAELFMNDWSMMWPEYRDYFDHATKATLQNIEDGKAATEAASDSAELAGAARIAPLVAFLADRPEDKVVQACVEQTALTHASDKSEEATVFLATATYRLVNGADLKETLRATAPSWALEKAEAVLTFDAVEAVDKLGQSCPIDKALPAVIYLALKYGQNPSKAFSENAISGGDNCARALALGMLLGAAHGAEWIPENWHRHLLAQEDLKALLEATKHA